jgi:signal transduction histidine kinase
MLSGVVWWRSAHLQARARRLEQLVDRRTAEVQEQAEQLEQYNRALQQSNRELNETLEEKSELLGVAAHDLKNPLFGIRGLAEVMLEDSDLEEGDHRKLKLIYESADETLMLINDLLDSAAASSGQVNLDLELIDLCEVAEWVVRRFEPQAERKDQHLTFIPTEADCTVHADEEKLREAMTNLVSNAVKYAPLGSRVEVEVRRSDGEVQFLVRDEGPGLSPKEQKNLFAPFQRLSPQPTGGESSSGLGLYIVKQLVDLHEGRVAVDSEQGEGSTFMLALPFAGQSQSRVHNEQIG